MKLIETHIAKVLENPVRFQEYGVGVFKTVPTKSGIKKAIKKKLVFIDGIEATTAKYISGGEKISLFQSEVSSVFKRLELPLEVLFEDGYFAIINKPPGILVSGNKFMTIANGLAQNLEKSTLPDAVRPQPVHRLDKATSGVLLIGKTSAAIRTLSALFLEKKIKKTYFAIAMGVMEPSGEIAQTVEGKEAHTTYEVLQKTPSERFGYLNLIRLQPQTGRKHQLRKHLFGIGNPILGDQNYFNEGFVLKGKGLYLHAATLSFVHPLTKVTVCITKALPKKFRTIFKNAFIHCAP